MWQAKDIKHDTIVADNTSAFPPFPHDNDEMETLFERMKDEEGEDDYEDNSEISEDMSEDDRRWDVNDENSEDDESEPKQSLYKKRSS